MTSKGGRVVPSTGVPGAGVPGAGMLGASSKPAPDALLGALRPFMPSFLSPERLDWCERVAAAVPAVAGSHYVECRPGTSERVDFMSSFESRSLAGEYRTALGHQQPAKFGHEPADRAYSAVWQSNLALLDAWGLPDSPLAAASRVWFEYDGPEAAATPETDAQHVGSRSPDASASVGLESDYYMRHVRALAGVSERSMAVLRTAAEILLPEPQRSQTWSVIARCLGALGPQGSVGYLSVMSARSPVVSKLFVILPRTQVDAFLTRIEWPGDRAYAQTLLRDFYAPSVRTAYLDLTLSDRVESKLGFATSQFQRRELSSADQTRWLRFPDSLPKEASELLRWPGVNIESMGQTRLSLSRWLDVKAVLDDDVVQYKAYLGFMPRF